MSSQVCWSDSFCLASVFYNNHRCTTDSSENHRFAESKSVAWECLFFAVVSGFFVALSSFSSALCLFVAAFFIAIFFPGRLYHMTIYIPKYTHQHFFNHRK